MRIITTLLLLISIHTFASFESDFTKIIDNNFDENAINGEKAKTEFFDYAKSNFKEKRCQTITIEKSRNSTNFAESEDVEFRPTIEPHFVGGVEAMVLYITKNIVYPAKAKQDNKQGVVYISFIVEKDGSITNISIPKSPNDLLSKEAIRVVQEMPKWKVGIQNGEKVRVLFTLPIHFRIQ